MAVLGLAPPALAQQTLACTKGERGLAEAALRNAKLLTLHAATAVGDTPAFARWFGKYDPPAGEEVRGTLKAVHRAIRSGAVEITCLRAGARCEDGIFAFVYDDRPHEVYLCPGFFRLPSMAGLRPQAAAGINGTREGTLIHEISHFRTVGATRDHCYTRPDCTEMAQAAPARARRNADSYQYFSEDVSLARRRGAGQGKAPPAAEEDRP